MSTTPPSDTDCPACGQPTHRVRRLNIDRARSDTKHGRRYQCSSEACGWQGLLFLDWSARRRAARAQAAEAEPDDAADEDAAPPAAVTRPARLAGWLGLLLGTAAVAGIPALVVVLMGLGVVADRHTLKALPLGESHDGRPLPARHPLQKVAYSAPVAGAEAAADEPPLAVREHCAWGQPGRSPYLGSTEQALRQARLPPEVVRRVAQMRRDGQVSDRLEIRTGAIRALGDGRQFNPRSFAMTFGRTLCLDARVNFVAGHVEKASLYEAHDQAGRRYSVMVPDVCGNVSVLGARGQRVGKRAVTVAMAAQGGPGPWWQKTSYDEDDAQQQGLLAWMASLQRALDQAADDPGRAVALGLNGARQVPEPGTLASVLAGLGVLVWVRRRRLAAR